MIVPCVRGREGAAKGARRRDIRYEEYGVAVELDGRAAHPGDMRL
jgi:hypothetical protein